MSVKQVTECDVCGAHKKDSNHWLKIWLSRGEFVATKESLILNNVDPMHPPIVILDVCGREHAMLLFSRFMATGSLEETQAEKNDER